jgi:prepilin-type processing-associated H-X9-DG protein
MLGRAKDQAKKGACAYQLSGHGRMIKVYVSGYGGTYPLYGPSDIGVESYRPYFAWGWSKFYGVMQASRITGTHKATRDSTGAQLGLWAYIWWNRLPEVWPGAVCPAMNAPEIWQKAVAALVAGDYTRYGKVAIHCGAIGYQWNVTLRGPGLVSLPGIPGGKNRWPNKLWQPSGSWDNTQWIDWELFLPGGQGPFVAQAISDEEINQPASIAEAWDSWDVGSCGQIDTSNWSVENTWPGWHVGPQSAGTNGWAILNAGRHRGSPNVLYADGHVSADAGRAIAVSDLGACPGGSWTGIQAVSWFDYDATYGTMSRILPRRERY